VEFKRSAGAFVAGISLFFGGPLLSFIGTTFGIWSVSRSDGSLSAIFIGLAVLGYIVGVVGLILLVVATQRALVKIDALPVRVQSTQRQSWPAV
jgi:hypothetical protein